MPQPPYGPFRHINAIVGLSQDGADAGSWACLSGLEYIQSPRHRTIPFIPIYSMMITDIGERDREFCALTMGNQNFDPQIIVITRYIAMT